MTRIILGSILALAVTLSLLAPCCSKSTGVDDEDTDRTPPDAVTDLRVIAFTSQSVTLQWTTPADHRDDNSGGMVDGYDLRLSYTSITPQTFSSAVAVADIPGPLPAGQPQSWPVDSLTPDSLYYFALKSVDDRGNWSEMSNCVGVHCPALIVVSFADTALERIVREKVGKPTGDLLSSDVDTIWELSAAQANITSLEGLQYFSSLVVGIFPHNEISDLSPLGALNNLAALYLYDNNITDLSPLFGKVRLHQLQVHDNPLSNIFPVGTLDSLQQLILVRTQVTDFSPLYSLEFLSDLGLDELGLTDISFMSQMKHPQICGLAFNSITSVEPLRNLSTLEALNLMQNQISDLEPLTQLTNLRELRLSGNQITDLAALVNNTGLDSGDVIYLEGNPLSQNATTTQIPALEGRKVTVHH